MLASNFALAIIIIVLFIFYNGALKRRVKAQPIPYEHFVKLEQNRMMGFYRFANYFTDVPHLRGSIRRRGWLNFVYNLIPYNKENAHNYLVFRTFIRTDDHFYLWVRLTFISGLIAIFVNIPIVTWVVAGALSFATTLQLKYALLSSSDFRMDRLYPIDSNLRKKAVQNVLRIFMVVQAFIVLICAIEQPLFFVTAIVVIVISEMTFMMSKDPSQIA